MGKPRLAFTEVQLKQIIESIANQDLTEFYDRYIHGTEELPFNDYLNAVKSWLAIDSIICLS